MLPTLNARGDVVLLFPGPVRAGALRLGDIVVARPSLARVFERLGLDYCCGGQQTLTAACARKGLDPHTVVVILTAAEAESAAPIEADTAGMTLS